MIFSRKIKTKQSEQNNERRKRNYSESEKKYCEICLSFLNDNYATAETWKQRGNARNEGRCRSIR